MRLTFEFANYPTLGNVTPSTVVSAIPVRPRYPRGSPSRSAQAVRGLRALWVWGRAPMASSVGEAEQAWRSPEVQGEGEQPGRHL